VHGPDAPGVTGAYGFLSHCTGWSQWHARGAWTTRRASTTRPSHASADRSALANAF